ncbi:hypothetical protein [Desulfobacter curvatus]|uniref:hypothetical protein n=1 Tax=Desulfobacter curvatus TaxID=2290 RepID=UPI00035C7C34|nr:hypothetical protein [Desulfobacter curvatus]
MKRRFNITLTLFIFAFVIVSISSGCVDAAQKKQSGPNENMVVCKEPRHDICTKEYRPVCGHFSDGTVKTFSNPCTACSNKNVVGFTHGPCSK